MVRPKCLELRVTMYPTTTSIGYHLLRCALTLLADRPRLLLRARAFVPLFFLFRRSCTHTRHGRHLCRMSHICHGERFDICTVVARSLICKLKLMVLTATSESSIATKTRPPSVIAVRMAADYYIEYAAAIARMRNVTHGSDYTSRQIDSRRLVPLELTRLDEMWAGVGWRRRWRARLLELAVARDSGICLGQRASRQTAFLQRSRVQHYHSNIKLPPLTFATVQN
jgi:hypothetical protein